MRLALLAPALICAFAAQAQPSPTVVLDGRRCATPEPSVTEVLESIRVVSDYRTAALRVAGGGPVVVPVAFHVVTDGGRGDVPDARIQAQLDTLNRAFRDVGYAFVPALVQRVDNARWYNGLRLGSAEDVEMKEALARDPARVLNVYTASLGLDYLGWADLPDANSERTRQTGVVLLDEALPGGSAAPYDLGHTGTHEVGHWVGLLHTFSGGCSAPNDGVADTPQERSGASGCPTSRDSCPSDPGLDPVHNYMDYSDDACMTEFTAGQVTRAQALMNQFRPTVSAGGYALAMLADSAFAGVPVGVAATASARVTNVTAQAFTVTGGSDAQGLARLVGAPVTVPAGGVADVAVEVTAAAEGAFATVLEIETTSGQAPTIPVAVSGRAARLAAVVATPGTVAATVPEGGSAQASLTFENPGDAPVTFLVEGFEPAASVAGLAVAAEPGEGTIPPGGQVEVALTVSASGVAPGTYDGAVVLTTDSPVQPRATVPAQVTVVVPPRARVAAEGLAVEVVETTGATVVFSLSNEGQLPLTFATGPEQWPAYVTDVSPRSGVVGPGESAEVTVTADAQALAPGAYADALTLDTNDPARPTVAVPLPFTILARPAALAAGPIYPNPGSGLVTIPIELPAATDGVDVEVFDVRGRLVAEVGRGLSLPVGFPEVRWDVRAVPPGLYVVRVRTPTDAAVARLVVVR